MSGRSKNHTLKGGTSPYSLSMGVSPPGLIVVKYTFKIYDGSTPAQHSTRNEYNFLVTYLVMYSTWLFQLRSLLIITPTIL